MPPRRLFLSFLVATGLLGGILLPGAVGLAADREGAKLSPEKIQRSIEKARDWLLREQEPNGSWQVAMRADDTRVGATALVMLALANAGVAPDQAQNDS